MKQSKKELTEEEQLALGAEIARDEQKRLDLLARARGGNIFLERLMIPFVMLVVAIVANQIGPDEFLYGQHVLFASALIIIPFGIQNYLLLRRQDALVELLERISSQQTAPANQTNS